MGENQEVEIHLNSHIFLGRSNFSLQHNKEDMMHILLFHFLAVDE